MIPPSKINTFANERQFQAAAYTLLNNEFFAFRGKVWHTKNEGKKGMQTALSDQAEGVLAGVPDLCIKYKGILFTIELKQPGKYLTDSQKRLHPIWNLDCPEIKVQVCYTLFEVWQYANWIIEQNWKIYRDL